MNNRCFILIVDDYTEEIMIITRVIKKFRPDCVIETASDNDDTINKIRNGFKPDLIFLDLKLPGLDGNEVLIHIRELDETRYTPIIILTSSTLNSDIMNAYNSGANSFIHKNHDLGKFSENIGTAIQYWKDYNITPEKASLTR